MVLKRYMPFHVYCSFIYSSQGRETTLVYIFGYINKEFDTCTYTQINTHTMEPYSAMREKKILPFATSCMKVKSIMLGEICQRKTNTV